MNPQEACGELGLLSGYCTCLDPNTWSKGYEAAAKLLVRSLSVFELGHPLSISTFWGSALNPSLNEISL